MAAALAPRSCQTKMDSSINDWEELPVELSTSYSQSPPLAENELLDEEVSSRTRTRDRDERADLRSGRQPLTAPIHPSQSLSRNDSELESNGPSKTGRIF